MIDEVRNWAGVSVVICCHNSAKRLPKTLAHLAAQDAPAGIPWEVVVIDNASTDETANLARSCWPEASAAPLRVIRESRLGLTYARECGFREARYELISFVDDDNWVSPAWVRTVAEVMTEHPEAGVCGGVNSPVCEVAPPGWFDEFKGVLAVSPDNMAFGDVTETDSLLGAGLTIRRSAWEAVLATGYRCFVMGRQGNILTAGDDSEICLAIRLAGWRFWRDARLKLQHFLPAGRLNWRFIRRLYRGYGVSSVQLDAYFFVHSGGEAGWKSRFRKKWQWHFLASAARLLRQPRRLLTFGRAWEGDPVILKMEVEAGRLRGFFRWRGSYGEGQERVRQLKLSAANGRPLEMAGGSPRS